MKVVFAHVGYLGGHPSRPEPKSTAERRGQLITDDFGIHLNPNPPILVSQPCPTRPERLWSVS
jgi:hypothetical protein